LENLALRHQLAVYKKTVTRPKMRRSDRLFWVALSRVWAGWRQALVIVSPNTVLRWQRRRFCEHWTKLSARPIAGRPPLTAEIRALVTTVDPATATCGDAVPLPSTSLRSSVCRRIDRSRPSRIEI
jgi:putative transposase